jgi:CRISPR/Cas system-associated exonuclease Cas4 (RecB family)
MDKLIKEYFDKYRIKDKLPPEIEGKVVGKLIKDTSLLGEWRSNYKNSHPQYYDKEFNAVLFGALDECLVDGDFYIPVDYKTRGFDLKEDSSSYYQTQLDAYTLLLEAEGYKHYSFGYLIYYIPIKVKENGIVEFKIDVQKMKTDPKRSLEIFHKAVKTLRSPRPKSHSQCKFCSWGNDFVHFQ